MIAVPQVTPTRAKVLEGTLLAPRPTTHEMLRTLKHTVEAHQGKLICHMRPTIGGTPQANRPWLDTQSGSNKVYNTGPQGHKLH
eukprot:11847181-Karenia_brevis.AAC.1